MMIISRLSEIPPPRRGQGALYFSTSCPSRRARRTRRSRATSPCAASSRARSSSSTPSRMPRRSGRYLGLTPSRTDAPEEGGPGAVREPRSVIPSFSASWPSSHSSMRSRTVSPTAHSSLPTHTVLSSGRLHSKLALSDGRRERKASVASDASAGADVDRRGATMLGWCRVLMKDPSKANASPDTRRSAPNKRGVMGCTPAVDPSPQFSARTAPRGAVTRCSCS